MAWPRTTTGRPAAKSQRQSNVSRSAWRGVGSERPVFIMAERIRRGSDAASHGLRLPDTSPARISVVIFIMLLHVSCVLVFQFRRHAPESCFLVVCFCFRRRWSVAKSAGAGQHSMSEGRWPPSARVNALGDLARGEEFSSRPAAQMRARAAHLGSRGVTGICEMPSGWPRAGMVSNQASFLDSVRAL